jgi:hypothetical protein
MIYKDIIKTTLASTYPKYSQEKVKKRLEQNSVISSSGSLFGDTVVVAPDASLLTQLNTVFDANPDELIRHVEDLEYFHTYKYATLFDLVNYDISVIEALIERGSIISYESNANDQCTRFSDEMVGVSPTYRKLNDSIDCLKFSNEITGYLPIRDDNQRIIKYPILVLIHKELNAVEIRLDKTKGYFRSGNGDDNFYTKQIAYVESWLGQNLGWDLSPINLAPVIEFIKPRLQRNGDIRVSAQAMDLATGSKAILDTGINDEFVLPLLGELQYLIADNLQLFESNEETKSIKELIENFIMETERTSNMPWLSLTWTHEVKARAVKVKFSFLPVYTLLNYYGSNAEMERMNDVTKYLIENRTDYLNEEPEFTPSPEVQ